MKYLLDTNVISELKRTKPHEQVLEWFASVPKESLFLSVLTLGEIRKGIEKLSDSPRKLALSNWLEIEISLWFDARLLKIDSGVADCWGRLQAISIRPLPAIDSLLAATALHHDLCLVTRNVSDFDYPNLTVLNLWQSND